MNKTLRSKTALKWAAVLGLTVFLAACVDSTETAPPPPPAGDTQSVTIQEMQFTPDQLTIEEGETVTWVWDDGDMPHDVSGDGFRSETQSGGAFFHTFEDAGDYPYVCNLHSGMRGTVTVVDR